MIRCDRAFGNNKGGVMMSVSESVQVDDVLRFTTNGIEGHTATVVFSF